MIKIIKAQPVPKEQIECANCGSILEYENVDLELHQGYMSGMVVSNKYQIEIKITAL